MKWFKHMSDTSEDLFIQDLENRFSDSGYAFWFKTLELIALHGKEGTLEISWAVYQQKIHKRRTQVELLLNFCSTSGKLNFSFDEKKIIISCKKFVEMTDNYTKYGKSLQRDLKVTEKKQTPEVEEEVEIDEEVEKTYSSETDFINVWNLYPNRQGKKSALRSYKATVKTEEDFARINLALKNYLKSFRVKNGYIKNGSTWFNEWQDWISPTEQMIGNNNAINTNSIKKSDQTARATFRHSDEQLANSSKLEESIRLLCSERS